MSGPGIIPGSLDRHWEARDEVLSKLLGAGGAKEFAESLEKELAEQWRTTTLTPGQATDGLAAIERLN